jgi:ribonuclease P protein component
VKVDQATQTKSQGRFPKSHRLLRHSEFERVYKQGRRHFSAHMTAFYLWRPEDELKGARVGFTVSKALGRAIQRNRIRRRLREAVRLNGFHYNMPVDIVINPKRSTLSAEFNDLQSEVTKAFQVIEKQFQRGKPQ